MTPNLKPGIDLEALALRCERAEAADRELDREIALLVGYTEHTDEDDPVYAREVSTWWKHPDEDDWSTTTVPPSFTHSIDAALQLVPEGWTLSQLLGPERRKGWSALIWTVDPESDLGPNAPRGRAATPALALCAAALRAGASS